MKKDPLDQALGSLAQPVPSPSLDEAILGSVRRSLALENYQKAEALLSAEGARLDQSARVGLASGMATIREQFGAGFDAAYAAYQKETASMQVSEPTSNHDLDR
jgi:hypothetical protein